MFGYRQHLQSKFYIVFPEIYIWEQRVADQDSVRLRKNLIRETILIRSILLNTTNNKAGEHKTQSKQDMQEH